MDNLIRTSPGPSSQTVERGGYPLNPVPETERFDLRRLWTVLNRRRLLIALITLTVTIAAAVFSFMITPTYRSTVSIQIEPEAVKVLPFNAVADSLVRSSNDFELYMKTQDVLLKSSALADRAVMRLSKEYPEPLPLASDSFASGLAVERVASSQVVSLHYVSLDPKFSALAANTIAEEFIRLHFQRKVEATQKATDFLEEQLAALRSNVVEAEDELMRYAQEHNILDTNENQQNLIRERFGRLSNELSQAQTSYFSVKAEFDELQKVTPDSIPASLRSPEMASLESAIRSVQQELASLLEQFGENWPEVVRKRRSLALLEEQLAGEKKAALERARRDVRLRLNTAQARYDSVSQSLSGQEQLVNRLNQATLKYNSLKRDLDASEQLFLGLLQRLKETGVDPGFEFGNIHITDVAKPSRMPYQPQPIWNISLAFLLGLSAGIGLAFLLDYLDPSFRGQADLEALGIPVLGWVPTMALKGTRGPKAVLEKETRPVAGNVLQLQPQTSAVVPFDQAPAITQDPRARESYRSICASLLLSKAESPARTILITSAIPREGKTTTALHLGTTLAETGASTLLIDSDFRNPSLSGKFRVANGKGLSVHLAGGELEIRETQLLSNLLFVPAGPLPPNPVALFNSPRFVETLNRLKEQFRFIVIDGPPLLSVAETAILASKVDGVILVVKAGETPKEVIARANAQLLRAGAYVLGATVNHLDLRDPEYSYFSKYYYSYYGAGHEGGSAASPKA